MFWGFGGFGRGFGWGRGFGAGAGRMFGRGFGWGARLGYCPWTGLPRGWRWMYPYAWGYGWYPYAYPYGTSTYSTPSYPYAGMNVNFLKTQAEMLEAELRRIENMINDIEKKGK